jgi:hypothetical protein
MNPCKKWGMQVVLDFASVDGAHGGSSGSIAYLKDARLERSLSAEGEKGKTGYCFKHTRCKNLRAVELPSRMEPVEGVRSQECLGGSRAEATRKSHR